MKEFETYIDSIKQINSSTQHIEVIVPPELLSLLPGQSVLAREALKRYEINRWEPYLRERWWPMMMKSDNRLVFERPIERRYRPQEIYSLLSPIGQPLRFRRRREMILLLAYDTVPSPLLYMLCWLKREDHTQISLLLAGSAQKYDTRHLPEEVEVIPVNDDLRWEQDIWTVGQATQIFVVVNQGDENLRMARVKKRIMAMRTEMPDNFLIGLFQSLIPCGIGACDACLLRVDGKYQHACTSGPGFDLMQVKLPDSDMD